MEEKSYNVVPILMALALAGAIIGGLAYFYFESKRTLTQQEANAMVTAMLKAKGPASVAFETGFVEPTVSSKPFDPHYKLLAKIGVLKTGKPTYKGLDVKLTPEGKKLLDECGAVASKKQGGQDTYTVPLAIRKLVKVESVEMVGTGIAKIEYTWNWAPTPLGDNFDVKSPPMQSLTQWESATMIEKYGADFYKNSEPKKVAFRVIWDDKLKQWEPYNP